MKIKEKNAFMLMKKTCTIFGIKFIIGNIFFTLHDLRSKIFYRELILTTIKILPFQKNILVQIK